MMKNRMRSGIVILTGIVFLMAFRNDQQSAITGRISPANAAENVWVISANDSIRAGVASGNFSVLVKPGTYKLFVDAKDPFKDVLLDNLDVKSNQALDIGEIILQQ
jgi:hypothetical protein